MVEVLDEPPTRLHWDHALFRAQNPRTQPLVFSPCHHLSVKRGPVVKACLAASASASAAAASPRALGPQLFPDLEILWTRADGVVVINDIKIIDVWADNLEEEFKHLCHLVTVQVRAVSSCLGFRA